LGFIFFVYFSRECRVQPEFRSTDMNKFEKACIKSRIERLAGLKCTGTPAALASKFEISDRSVKRIIKEMREEGIEIRFDYNRMSYVIE
jgi:hypothetical protein